MYCFTAKLSGFTKISKVKMWVFKSVLSSSSKNTGPVTRDHVKSSQIRNETPLQREGKSFPFMPEQVQYFYF